MQHPLTYSSSPQERSKRVVLALWIVLAMLAIVNFLPHHGPPAFRYTGSDPSRDVWNFGWPIVMLIYDPRSGFHEGPLCLVLVPELGVVGLVFFLIHHRQRR